MSDTKRIIINGEWRKQLLRLPWLLLIPLGLLMPRIAALNPDGIEKIYSNAVYPVISAAISSFTGLFSFSVCELLLYALAVLMVLIVIIPTAGLLMRRIKPVRFISGLITLLIIAGALLNGFYLVWGFNYSRPSLYELLEMPKKFHSVKALERLCIQLASKANEIRPYLYEDETGVFILSDEPTACFMRLPEAYEALENELFNRQKAAIAKPVIFSSGLSAAGIAGIYVPFTAEPNVNVDQPALLLPSSAAHEMAHYLGFAREDEANFIAFLACMASDDYEIRYSGIMLALITCSNELSSCDRAAYVHLYERYSDAMVRDLKQYNAYWKSFESPVRETATKINDNYLKSNMQSTGVKSYNLMVDLMLAYYTSLPEL